MRKVLTLQTIPAREEDDYGNDQLGRIGGFSLHAGVAVNTRERMTPTRSGKVKKPTADAEADERQEPDLSAGKSKGMGWAQRLKRVFNMEHARRRQGFAGRHLQSTVS